MIPITKNEAQLIGVIDVHGNIHEPTYPKRAKGLIKKGRARFVDEGTICLLDTSCDTDDLSGDIKMSDVNIDNINKSDYEQLCDALNNSTINGRSMMEVAKEYFAGESSKSTPDMSYIMSRIDKIMESDDHIKNAVKAIENMVPNDCPDGGTGDAGRASAIQAAVQSRETTNQRLLDMLNKMYDDIKPQKPVSNAEMLETILSSCHGGPFSQETAMLLDKVQNLMDHMGMSLPDSAPETNESMIRVIKRTTTSANE